MNTIVKKEFEEFLITMDFEDRFEILEYISSFSVVCINLSTGENVSNSLLFLEDSFYQDIDIVYGEGRYGGMPDNALYSTTFGVRNGVQNLKYKITIKTITTLGNIYEEDIILTIINTVEDYFQKQPSEKFAVLMCFTNRLYNDDVRYEDAISTQSVVVVRGSDASDMTDDIIFTSGLEGTEKVKIVINAGSNMERYRITNKVVSTQGYKYQMDVLMAVKEK